MRLFISAGEPSGDLHGASLIQALRRRQPDIEIHGFGGDRMSGAGCRIHYPLTELAGVGLLRVLSSIPRVPAILKQAGQLFGELRPDALVLIDFPAFHWWLAKRARKHGIPVVWFVPPQLWAWASWRVKWMRRLADHVLCTLPFEEEWYRQRGVAARYIGHPYFDELHERRLDEAFVAEQRSRPGTVIALLPGSRRQEVRHNFQAMADAAAMLHARRSDVRFLVACLRPEHGRLIEEQLGGRSLPIEVHVGRTAEIIHLAHSAIAKSGSVGLELLYHGKPAVVAYQLHWLEVLGSRFIIQCPYISLVNLLAGKELFPEYLASRLPAQAMAGHILRWLDDPAAYSGVQAELAALRRRAAAPGACERAADVVLDVLAGPPAGGLLSRKRAG
ncbi:MAG TPA: lipid-A-disaccharide synthase [Gemmataceae bacterium]|nr:lipid-A-disaccharide synthase [Gemmataceae bacterium]